MRSMSVFPIIKKNIPDKLNRDLYHDLLTMGWRKTILLFMGFYISTNAFFATLYYLQPNSIENSDGTWVSAFFFSVQTMATIGYGHFHPATLYTHVLVTIEAALGLIIIAIMTGFFFAKFSRALSKVEFTRHVVITTFDGKPTLLFRMINIRHNEILDSTVHVSLLRPIQTREGHEMRKFIDLKLVRDKVPLFAMSINIMHVIDEESPLYGLEEKSFLKLAPEILVTAVGIDSTFGQTIHASHLYRANDIIWGKRFADMVELLPDGTRLVDYAKFNELT